MPFPLRCHCSEQDVGCRARYPAKYFRGKIQCACRNLPAALHGPSPCGNDEHGGGIVMPKLAQARRRDFRQYRPRLSRREHFEDNDGQQTQRRTPGRRPAPWFCHNGFFAAQVLWRRFCDPVFKPVPVHCLRDWMWRSAFNAFFGPKMFGHLLGQINSGNMAAGTAERSGQTLEAPALVMCDGSVSASAFFNVVRFMAQIFDHRRVLAGKRLEILVSGVGIWHLRVRVEDDPPPWPVSYLAHAMERRN